jgi:hypothetical protein
VDRMVSTLLERHYSNPRAALDVASSFVESRV